MASKHAKRCSLCSEMQVETVRHHRIPFRTARIQNTTKCGRIWSNRDAGSLLVEAQNGTHTLEGSWLFSYELSIIFLYNPAIMLLSVYLKELIT